MLVEKSRVVVAAGESISFGMYREAIMTSDTSIRPVLNVLVHKRCKQRNVFEKLVVQAVVLVEEGADAGHALQGGGAHETVAQGKEQRVREHSI